MKAFKHLTHLAFGALLLFATSLQAQPGALTPKYVDTLVGPYLDIQTGLAGDDLSAAQDGANALLTALEQKPTGHANELKAPTKKIAEASDIKTARAAFLPLSEKMTALVKMIGTTGDTPLFVAHCPMAFGGKGGDWIQSDQTVANPYYGSMMLRCGGINEQIAGEGQSGHSGGHTDGGHHMEHGHGGMEHHSDGAYSPSNLDAVHAGVPAYFAQASTTGALSTEDKASGGCDTACCADN